MGPKHNKSLIDNNNVGWNQSGVINQLHSTMFDNNNQSIHSIPTNYILYTAVCVEDRFIPTIMSDISGDIFINSEHINVLHIMMYIQSDSICQTFGIQLV